MSDCRDWFRFNHKWDAWQFYKQVEFYRETPEDRFPTAIHDIYRRYCSVCGKTQHKKTDLADL